MGASGGKGSGGGSGGSIRIEAGTITTLYNASASGGSGGNFGGNGGQGRIAVYYQNTFSGSFTPGYLEKAGAADTIFHDDLEANNLNQWSSNVNDSGSLAASNSADYWGLYGLQAVIDDNTVIYVQDNTPNNETEYRARFYVNPNGVTMASGDILDLCTGYTNGTAVFHVQLQKNATSYQIRTGLLSDASAWTESSWYDITNSWNAVEIDYQALINDGNITLWLNDVQKQTITHIDNDTRTVTEARLGAQGIETGTRGTIFFDDFDSRRFSYIGILPDPGVYDPQATNQTGWKAYTYHYTGTRPHAVTSVDIEGGSTNSYEYDANGNMTCRIENGVSFKQTYNAENRIDAVLKLSQGTCASVTKVDKQWDFTYDGDGTRVKQIYTIWNQDSPQTILSTLTTSYYMGGAYEVAGNSIKKYYSIAGMMVAMNDGTGL